MASHSNSSSSLVSEVGNWVSGASFWGREGEIRSLAELLRNGAHVSITAPRRIGKTSLMREVARRLEGEFLAIHVDLQSASRPEDLVAELSVVSSPWRNPSRHLAWSFRRGLCRLSLQYAQYSCASASRPRRKSRREEPRWVAPRTASREHRDLHRRVLDVFRGAIGSLEGLEYSELSLKIRDAATPDWQSKADRLLEEFVANTPPVVVYIDELAILVNRLLKGFDYVITPERIALVDQLMSWLRYSTIRHAHRIRFVIASSIGLGPVLSQARLSATLNTFTAFPLAPWDRDTAMGALEALARALHVEWAPGGREALVDRLGVCIPHHVQVFWAHLQLDARRRNVFCVRPEDVERVFRADMLGASGHAELSHYEERLGLMLGERLLPLAIDLLSEAALTGSLTIPALRQLAAEYTRPQQLEVLDVLLHDGYLQFEDEVYTFPSAFLREWWKARHRTTHRTLAERGNHV